MSQPLTPLDCDLRDFQRMMLDVQRLRGSEFDTTLDDSAWRAGLNLWMTAWHQVPAASLPTDEAALAKAAGLGRDLRTWKKVRATALRGWIECDDGLMYHEVVAEIALEAWIDKLGQRLSSAAGNAKRHGYEFEPGAIQADIVAAAEMLSRLNPKSRHLSKQHVVKATKAAPSAIPAGGKKLPPGASREPTGSPSAIPVGSQGNGMERNSSEDKSSDGDAVVVPIDPDKSAWAMAAEVVCTQGRVTQSVARSFFGKLLSENGLQAKDMLPALAKALEIQTQDPCAYLRRAAAQIAKRRNDSGPPKRVAFV